MADVWSMGQVFQLMRMKLLIISNLQLTKEMRLANTPMAYVWHTGQVFQSIRMKLLVISNLQLTKDMRMVNATTTESLNRLEPTKQMEM
jgi:hypothetical protein